MRKKDRLEEVKKWYRRFKHNLMYKENYCKRIMIILITVILFDLIVLYLVW